VFEQAIFEHIRDNFTVSGYDFTFGIGEVPAATETPYIIQYSLDMNGDSQVLCNDNDFTDGEAFIQWNIYHSSFSNALYIKKKLMEFVATITTMSFNSSTYVVLLNTSESSPSGIDLTNGLATEVVARNFTYNKQ
jgi:hypothetical protein